MAPVAGVTLPTHGPHEGSHVREGAAGEGGGAPLVPPPSKKEHGTGVVEVEGLSVGEK